QHCKSRYGDAIQHYPSFLLYGENRWQVVYIQLVSRPDHLSSAWRRELELVGSNLGAGFPRAHIKGVLRPSFDLSGRNDISARIRLGAFCNPYLPIEFLRPEGKMITLRATND